MFRRSAYGASIKLSHQLVVMITKSFHLEFVMSFIKPLALAALAIASVAAQATTVSLATDGQWHSFGVDSFSASSGGTEWIDNDDTNAMGYGTPLDFNFTVASGYVARLTVVDASLAGDAFVLFNASASLGATSVVPVQHYSSAPDIGLDYDAALLNNNFSRGVFNLGAGTYSIRGALTQSLLLDDGSPINATAGALKVSISAVPEPGAVELVLAAFGVVLLLWKRISSR
jgi:hypothetical protein